MSIGCRLFINWSSKFQSIDNCLRPQIKDLIYDLLDNFLRIFSSSKCLRRNGYRLCNTNRIGEFNFQFFSNTSRHKIFCYPSGRISCRAVNFCCVFSRKCSASVTTTSAISIYNNLSSGQSRISLRTSNHKSSSRINEIFCIFVQEFIWQNCLNYIFCDIFLNLFLSHLFIVLRRNDNGINSLYTVVIIKFYCDL